MKSTSPRPIVVGMNPSKRLRGIRPGPSIRRLNRWMEHLGVDLYSFINATQKDNPTLRDIDPEVLAIAKTYDKVLALGGFASSALRSMSIPHFTLPHPSPRNRKFNDPKFEQGVLEKCANYLNA